MRTGLLFGACLLASCGDGGGDDEPPDAPPAPTERLEIAAARGSYDLAFSIDVAGRGSGPIGAVSIQDGFGTIAIHAQTLPVAIYEKVPWPEFDYTLYQALAIAPDRWYVLWFYCRAKELTYIWIEGTSGPVLSYQNSEGSCGESDTPSTVSASFPAGDLGVPPLARGFQVTGEDISIPESAPGMVRIGGVQLTVYTFGTVNCSTACGAPGWYELHALLWDSSIQSLCFGIFYLFPGLPMVTLEYSFSLPALQDPFGYQIFRASFTHP